MPLCTFNLPHSLLQAGCAPRRWIQHLHWGRDARTRLCSARGTLPPGLEKARKGKKTTILCLKQTGKRFPSKLQLRGAPSPPYLAPGSPPTPPSPSPASERPEREREKQPPRERKAQTRRASPYLGNELEEGVGVESSNRQSYEVEEQPLVKGLLHEGHHAGSHQRAQGDDGDAEETVTPDWDSQTHPGRREGTRSTWGWAGKESTPTGRREEGGREGREEDIH